MVASVTIPNGKQQYATSTDEPQPKKSRLNTKKWFDKQKKNMSTRDFWARRFPLINWLSGYNTSFFVSDLIAGLTVGLTVIPQGMACAVVAGLPPQYGLYSAFMGCFIYLFFGTSKDITIGPTAISAMLIKPYADKFGPEVAVLICFFSGCIISVMGILRLGFIVDFISMPVIAGFMSAGAISIASGQVASLLGIKGEGSEFLEYWTHVFKHIKETKLWDPILGFSCIIILLLLRQASKYASLQGRSTVSTGEKIWRGVLKYVALGRNAIIVILTTVMIALIMGDGTPPVNITGPVQEGFPHFGPPSFVVSYLNSNETLSFNEAFKELSSSIIIPFVLILESIAIAKAFAKGKTIDATQEMLALGLSNVLGSFVQSFPVTGSFTRTAVNNASGVKTPVGGIYTGALVLLCLAFLTRFLQYIPKATLAAVIICAVIFMVEIREATHHVWKSNKMDLIPLYTTFLGCLLISLDIGIVIGIAINLLFILYEAARPKMKIENVKVLSQEVLLVTPDRSITYPAAEFVKEKISNSCLGAQPGLLVVVDGVSIHSMDSTAIKVLKSLLEDLETRQQPIVLWNWSRSLVHNFVGFDNKGSEFFRHSELLEELLTDSQPDLEGQGDHLIPPEAWAPIA